MKIELSLSEKRFVNSLSAFAVVTAAGVCMTELFARVVGPYRSYLRRVGFSLSAVLGTAAGIDAYMRTGKKRRKILNFTSSQSRVRGDD